MSENKIGLPAGDYVSPGLAIIRLDSAFPFMIAGNPEDSTWPYLERGPGHSWYVDRRNPTVGFVNRDEAMLLFNNALLFPGRPCLEIGCWRGWSAAHIASGSGSLDLIDPVLQDPVFAADVRSSFTRAGLGDCVTMDSGASPEAVDRLARAASKRWSFVFIDGDHEGSAPLQDAQAVEHHVADTAMIMFHDLMSPSVAAGLDYFRSRGWSTRLYRTMQVMGVAWRGHIEPVEHIADPAILGELPPHLKGYSLDTEPTEGPGRAPMQAGPSGNQQATEWHLLGHGSDGLSSEEFDKLQAQLVSQLTTLTCLTVGQERDAEHIAALTAKLEDREVALERLEADYAALTARSGQVHATGRLAASRISGLELQLAQIKNERGALQRELATARDEHSSALAKVDKFQAEQANWAGLTAIAPPETVEADWAAPPIEPDPPLPAFEQEWVAPPIEPLAWPLAPQSPAPAQAAAFARTVARPRVVFGLLRSAVVSRSSARAASQQIARDHGLDSGPAMVVADWLAQPRVSSGLLRRSLLGQGDAAQRAVLKQLDHAFQVAVLRLTGPGSQEYHRLAVELDRRTLVAQQYCNELARRTRLLHQAAADREPRTALLHRFATELDRRSAARERLSAELKQQRLSMLQLQSEMQSLQDDIARLNSEAARLQAEAVLRDGQHSDHLKSLAAVEAAKVVDEDTILELHIALATARAAASSEG